MPAETNYSSTPLSGTGQDETNVIGNPGGSIQDAMETSRNRLASAYAAMQERSNEMLQGAERYVQERPFQAVVYAASIGAVIGFVAGMLLGGGRSSNGSSWYRRWW